jgi:1-pyrroline-5-carboxylate dehydrogenase
VETPAFVPEPALDLQDAEIRARLQAALATQRDRLGADHLAVIGGTERGAEHWLTSSEPANASGQGHIGRVPIAAPGDVDDALAAAWAAFERWRAVSDEERAALLLRVADLIRARAAELAALVLLETGKPWAEAVGEIAESIDFLHYHATQLATLRAREAAAVHPHPSEDNAYRYLPLGAGALLPTWPFPIAQTTGMLSAAVVCGNAAVVKPASLAPVTARSVIDLWLDAGTPPGVVNVVFGPGTQVGRALTAHRDTRFVTLTGSARTGLDAHAAATARHPTRRWFTRVNLELSGNNAVVVDETADLDAAAEAIVAGAFSFQGQKCSAGSRVVVVATVREPLVERIAARTAALRVGDPASFDTDVGPLIDDAAVARTLRYVAIGRVEGRHVLGGERHQAGPAVCDPRGLRPCPGRRAPRPGRGAGPGPSGDRRGEPRGRLRYRQRHPLG